MLQNGQINLLTTLMYPLRDTNLMLSHLAREWARELPPRPTEQAVMTLLLRAVWQRELGVFHLNDKPAHTEDLLRLVSLSEQNPGFAIYSNSAPERMTSVELPDGGVEFHLKRYVILPADLDHLSAEQRQSAIEELSAMQFDDFSEAFRGFVSMLRVTREEFGRYCDEAGYPRPMFWFGKAKAQVSKAKPEADCAKWLRSLIQEGRRHPKPWYLDEALRQFPKLSERGFNRVWRRTVPASWRARGAMGKKAVR